MPLRRRSGPRHTAHWTPEEWERRESGRYEARCRRRAAERQSRARGGLIPAGLLLLAGMTGSAIPIAVLMLLMACGAVLLVFGGLGNWLRGR